MKAKHTVLIAGSIFVALIATQCILYYCSPSPWKHENDADIANVLSVVNVVLIAVPLVVLILSFVASHVFDSKLERSERLMRDKFEIYKMAFAHIKKDQDITQNEAKQMSLDIAKVKQDLIVMFDKYKKSADEANADIKKKIDGYEQRLTMLTNNLKNIEDKIRK